MPRGPLEVRIQAIGAAYHYTHELNIIKFCGVLRQTVDPSHKRMYWHPKTNELHRDALEALAKVADDLKKIRGEVKLRNIDPKVVKMESMKQMDKYLDTAQPELVDKVKKALSTRQQYYPEHNTPSASQAKPRVRIRNLATKDFKRIEDAYGRHADSLQLQAVAALARECDELPGRLRQKRDADFLSALATVATQVQAVMTTADQEQWGHDQMIHDMDKVLENNLPSLQSLFEKVLQRIISALSKDKTAEGEAQTGVYRRRGTSDSRTREDPALFPLAGASTSRQHRLDDHAAGPAPERKAKKASHQNLKLPTIDFQKLQEVYGKNVTTGALQKYKAMADFCDQVGFRWSRKAEHFFLAALAGIVEDVQASRAKAIHEQSSEPHTLQQMDKILDNNLLRLQKLLKEVAETHGESYLYDESEVRLHFPELC